jgi:hypothetical protein
VELNLEARTGVVALTVECTTLVKYFALEDLLEERKRNRGPRYHGSASDSGYLSYCGSRIGQ